MKAVVLLSCFLVVAFATSDMAAHDAHTVRLSQPLTGRWLTPVSLALQDFLHSNANAECFDLTVAEEQ